MNVADATFARAVDDVACTHCGLPVPAAFVEDGAAEQFCCSGCRTVYAAIHGAGLDQYYRYRDQAGEAGVRARTTDKSYAELDDPAFIASYCRPVGAGQLSVDLYLEGVHCSACVWLVERATMLVEGAREATLDVGRSSVRIVWDPGQTALSAIARELDALGYPPHPQPGAHSLELRRREDRALLGRIAVAGAAAGNVMLMSFALYSGMFAGMDAEYVALFRWGSFAVTLPAVLWSGSVFFRGAWAALRTRTPHMDLPISLGLVAGFIWGAVGTIGAAGEVYFDSVTSLIFLLLVGRWVQRRQQRSASDAAELLFSLSPSSARLVEGDRVRDVPVEAVPLGALVEVRAGEHVPADGVVETGASTLDASLLTGESRAEQVTPGSPVHAGCINLSSRLVVRVSATGAETRVGQLMKSVAEAARRRAPVVALADRISGWFVLVVIALAALTLAVWWHAGASVAVGRAVALLIVTCPCALGLATPLAVAAAVGKAAREGILIKGGDALERAAHPGLVVFDKTGTLTGGRLALVAWHGDESVKTLVRAAELASAHPVAAALVQALPVQDHDVRDLRQTPGAGVEATLDGRSLRVGSPAFVGPLPEWASECVAEAAGQAHTPVVVEVDGQVRAVAELGDPLRPDAARSICALRRLGYEVTVLSGDHPDVVAAVARELAVPGLVARGGATPEQKLRFVEEALARGPVIMVGDGVNDAAALSAATLGVAVHGGAEASLAAADVFTTRAGVAPVVDLVQGARRTLGIVRRNLAFSLVYNLVGVVLALAGVVGPLLAALLMPLSSITVVASSFRSRTFDAAAGRRARRVPRRPGSPLHQPWSPPR